MSNTVFRHSLFFTLFLAEASVLLQAASISAAGNNYPLCSGSVQPDQYNNILIPVGGEDLRNCTIVAAVSTTLNFKCADPHQYHLHGEDIGSSSMDDTSSVYSAVWYITINGFTRVAGLSLQTGSLEFILNVEPEYLNQEVTIQCGLCLYDSSKGATDCERLHIHGFYPIQLSDPIAIMAFDSPYSLESEVTGLSVTLSWSPSSPLSTTTSYTAQSTPLTSTTASYEVFIEAIRDDVTVAVFEKLVTETSITFRSCDLQEKLFADTYKWSVVKIVAGKTSLKIDAKEEFQFNRTMTCEEGDTRLVDGSNCNEGRIEICLANNTWGTVCDDLWNEFNSKVVCNSLGIPGSAVARYFGPGEDDEPIALDNVRCYGNEANLIECRSGSNLDCSHFEDVGVACGLSPQCEDGEIRLIDGDALNAGRVEVCQLSVWGTVCDDGFTQTSARVACRQLGFKDAITFIGEAHYGPGYGSVVLDEVACTGSELSLFDCPRADFHNCDHFEDVSVVCEANCINGEVRLAPDNGVIMESTGVGVGTSGLVEVCIDKGWGYLYDSDWTDEDAWVVCNQLKIDSIRVLGVYGAGFQLPKNVTRYAIVHHYSVVCTGEETMIRDCDLIKRRRHSQGYVVDVVGVMCQVTLLADMSTTSVLQPSSSVITIIDTLTSTAVVVGGVGALIVITVVNVVVIGLAVCLIHRKKRNNTRLESNPTPPHPSPAPYISPTPGNRHHPQTRPIYINKVLPQPSAAARRRNNYTDNIIADSGIATTVFGSGDVGSSSLEGEDRNSTNDEYMIILGDDKRGLEGGASEYATLRNCTNNNAESAEATTGHSGDSAVINDDDDGVYSVPVIPNGTQNCNRSSGKVVVSNQLSTQSNSTSISITSAVTDVDSPCHSRDSHQPLVTVDDEVYSYPDEGRVHGNCENPSHTNTQQQKLQSVPSGKGVEDGHQDSNTALQTQSSSNINDILMVQNNAYDVGQRSSTDSTGGLLQRRAESGEEQLTEKGMGEDSLGHHYYNQIPITSSTPHR